MYRDEVQEPTAVNKSAEIGSDLHGWLQGVVGAQRGCVLVISQERVIIALNRAAHGDLQLPNGLLQLSGRQVSFRNQQQQLRFERGLRCLKEDQTLQQCRIEALDERGPQVIRVWKIALPVPEGSALPQPPHFLVTWIPELTADTRILASFGVTPAEGKLVLSLSNGETLNAYAERVKLSYETVRSQLRSVMAKLNVRRQTDLLRLVLRLSI